MPEYLDDPSVLTKDKLKSELAANNVELPSGNPTKDVYVQLYLKNLTAQNQKQVPTATLDAFSSDEELPPPVVSNRSRSSGRKATRKSDKILPDELDVTQLTDDGLRDELVKLGVDAGPIVASTRKLYEKKLQKLLDNGPSQPLVSAVTPTEIGVNHNGNSDELYSDKEDEVTPEPQIEMEPEPEPEPESVPEPEPEPAPIVERPVRSHGKTPVTIRTRSGNHSTVEKIAATEDIPKAEEKAVLKELHPNNLSSPSGISATCRRPIRGAAGRPVKPSDLWNDENLFQFSPKSTKTTTTTSSYTENRTIHRVASQPPAVRSSFSSSSKAASTAPPSGQAKPVSRGMSLWLKLLLLVIAGAFVFFVYQAMEPNTISPFIGSGADSEQTSSNVDSAA